MASFPSPEQCLRHRGEEQTGKGDAPQEDSDTDAFEKPHLPKQTTAVNMRALLKGDIPNLLPWLSIRAPATAPGHLSWIPGTHIGGEN